MTFAGNLARRSRPGSGKISDPSLTDPAAIRAAISQFLIDARQPVLLEPGDDPFVIHMDAGSPENLLVSGSEPGGAEGRLTLECWRVEGDAGTAAPSGTLVRRIVGIRSQGRAKLELDTEHFGKRTGVLSLIDTARGLDSGARRQSGRLKYREQFRLSLKRQFPDWKLVELSTEQDLEHSLSPAYPRALLRKGNQRMAAIGAAEDCLHPDGVLSFGLIWLDYLRRREKGSPVGTLALFLPIGFEANTCHRVRYLNPDAVTCLVFAYGSGITEERVDPAAYTNFETRLHPVITPGWSLGNLRTDGPMEDESASPLFSSRGSRYDFVAEGVRRLRAIKGVDCVPLPSGCVSLRVRGLEFARVETADRNDAKASRLLYGLDRKRTATAGSLPEIAALAQGLLRLREATAADRGNRLYLRNPEAWLESRVRAHLDRVDADLYTSPIYEQAPQFTSGERSVMDLLGVDRDGRLCVIEIKAAQDIHLPLQALDYWMRVKWHLERGEFGGKGYFPGIPLRRGEGHEHAPRLLLVAPATEFHPTNETILRYLSSAIAVQRIGVGIEWRRDLRVMLRQ